MKPTVPEEYISLAINSQVAGLRVMGTRQIAWFDKHFKNTTCFSIGRTSGSDMRIRDDSVSRLHCMVEQFEPGRYRLIDCRASNGILVSHFGRFTDYVEARRVEIGIFMRIKLGCVKLAPVLADGKSPIIATTTDMFALEAFDIYGSPHAAAQNTGLPSGRLARLADHFRAMLDKRRRGKRRAKDKAKAAKAAKRKKKAKK